MRIFRWVAARAAANFLGALAAVVAIFLAVDFAENASAFRGQGWAAAAAELYANRAAQVSWQVAPVAMILSAALTASGLRRTREYTALRALGLGPARVAGPTLAVGLAAAAAVAVVGDRFAVEAGARGDEIMATRFGRAVAGWHRWRERKSWFRGSGGRRVYHLREGAAGAYERATVYELDGDFRLARRIDAARMAPGEAPGRWRLEDGEERRFGAGAGVDRFGAREYDFGDGSEAFSVLPGRPGQMRSGLLARQVEVRRTLGLATTEHLLEWHRRWSWPLAGVAGGTVALAAALRRARKGHFTASLVESVVVSLAFWMFHGACWSLGLSERLPPAVAAWAACALFFAAGLAALRRLA